MARLITPWSVKGIDDETRELARRKSKDAGINIGAWINRAILEHGSHEHHGATDLPNVSGAGVSEKLDPKHSFDENSDNVISQRLHQVNKNLDGELRPMMFALNNLALRLAAAEVLQNNEPKKIDRTEQLVPKPELSKAVEREIIDEELEEEELINEQPTPSLERPDPSPPVDDFNNEIDVPKTFQQNKNMEQESGPRSQNRRSSSKSIGLKGFLTLLGLIVFSAVGTASFYFFPQKTSQIVKEINVVTEHHLGSVSKTLNDALLYSQRLLASFLGKNGNAIEREKNSSINEGFGHNNESPKNIENNIESEKPSALSNHLVIPNVKTSVSKSKAALNENQKIASITNFRSKDITPKKISKFLQDKANNGDALAQYKLGLHWIKKGKNQKNYLKAATWFKLAAVQGLKEAQYSLGVLYDTGVGLEKDESQAFLWYHAAASNHHPMAQFNIANFYLVRASGKEDFESALSWFELASKNGVDEASHNVSILSTVDIFSKLEKSDMLKLYTRESGKQLNKLSRATISSKLKNVNATQKVELKSGLTLSIQKNLRLNGFYLGPIDGQLGPNTRAAISVYQLENGFRVSGMPSVQLLDYMKQETNK